MRHGYRNFRLWPPLVLDRHRPIQATWRHALPQKGAGLGLWASLRGCSHVVDRSPACDRAGDVASDSQTGSSVAERGTGAKSTSAQAHSGRRGRPGAGQGQGRYGAPHAQGAADCDCAPPAAQPSPARGPRGGRPPARRGSSSTGRQTRSPSPLPVQRLRSPPRRGRASGGPQPLLVLAQAAPGSQSHSRYPSLVRPQAASAPAAPGRPGR